MSRRELGALLGILAVALVLRVLGIDWSLPSAVHLFTYHPDESLVITAAHRVDLLQGKLNPGFYNYGSFYIYLVSLAAPPVSLLLGIPPRGDLGPSTLFAWHLAARLLTALMGTATVYLCFLIGRRLWGASGGLLAALLLALAPLHVVHSHYATVDAPTTLWVALSLYAAVRIATRGPRPAASKPPSRAPSPAPAPAGGHRALTFEALRPAFPYLLAGAAAGMAAATKYNAALVLVACVTAHLASPRRRTRDLLWAGLAALVAFALLCPGAWLYTAQFLRDFLYETRHTRTGHGLVFLNTGSGWWYHFRVNLWQSLGGFPTLLLALTVPWALARRRPGEWALLSFGLLWFLAMGLFAVRFGRYMVPLLPALLPLLAGLLVEGYREYAASEDRRRFRWVALAAGALVLLQFTAASAQQVGRLMGPDPRDRALAWLRRNTGGRVVGLGTVPWFYTPPVSPYNGGPMSDRAFREHPELWKVRLKVTSYQAEALATDPPAFLALSDFEVIDPLRLAGEPIADPGARQQVADFLGFWRLLQARYRVAVGINAAGPPPHPGSRGSLVSHDWHYPNPTLWVWRRVDLPGGG